MRQSSEAVSGETSGKKCNIAVEVVTNFAGRYSILLAMLALFAIFSLTSEYFFTYSNVINILQQVSILGIIVIGETMVILIRGIDISPGAVVLLSSVITGGLMTRFPENVLVAIGVGLAAGALVGLFNGTLIEVAKISPIITTFGTMLGIRGLAQILLAHCGSWILMDAPSFEFIAVTRIGFIPFLVIVLLVMYVFAYILLSTTRFGRYIYATGNNPVAAMLVGIRVVPIKIGIYGLAGLLSGFAGILLSARTGIIVPTVGTGLEFDAIAAAFIGGISLRGGVGRIQNVLVGVIIVGLILNYMTLAHISMYYQKATVGFLILIAVILDRIARGRLQ